MACFGFHSLSVSLAVSLAVSMNGPLYCIFQSTDVCVWFFSYFMPLSVTAVALHGHSISAASTFSITHWTALATIRAFSLVFVYDGRCYIRFIYVSSHPCDSVQLSFVVALCELNRCWCMPVILLYIYLLINVRLLSALWNLYNITTTTSMNSNNKYNKRFVGCCFFFSSKLFDIITSCSHHPNARH